MKNVSITKNTGDFKMNNSGLEEIQIEQIVNEIIRPKPLESGIQFSGASFGPRFSRAVKTLGLEVNQSDVLRCWAKLWEYITNGVLAPGSDSTNMDLPFLHLTKYGRDIIQGITPYSEHSYIQKIESVCNPLLDDISKMYLRETLKSLYRQCYLGGMILLGGFSEKVFLNFLDLFLNCIHNSTKKASFESKINNKFLATKFNEFLKFLNPLKANLPRDLRHQLNLWLNNFFNYVRNVRNKVGHPTGREISKEELYAMLLTFPRYLEALNKLADYFQKNPIT